VLYPSHPCPKHFLCPFLHSFSISCNSSLYSSLIHQKPLVCFLISIVFALFLVVSGVFVYV
jgi:hypothetical protein